MQPKSLLTIFCLLFFTGISSAQHQRLQNLLDSLRDAGSFPGMNAAIIKADNTLISISSGFNDAERKIPMKQTDRMMQGSVGKTYVAAIAMKLVSIGSVKLDAKVSDFLGHHPWFTRIPNAPDITIRMLMNHSSGVMRYEFKEAFAIDLAKNPDKEWTPSELLQYILDEKATFPAGTGWEYSDTNYILLGLVIEKVTGKKYEDLLDQWILQPLGLKETAPSNKRVLPFLSQGYAGENKQFGGKDKVIEDGKFIINPQFEWTGGGVYSTTTDLTKWAKYLYEGRFIDSSVVKQMMNEAVPAKLGRDVKYGLGVIVRPTAIGTGYGHSGFFPGYLTEVLYFPDHKMAIAVQANSSDFGRIKLSLLRILVEMGKSAI